MKARWMMLCALLVVVSPAVALAQGQADIAKLKGKWTAKVGPNQDIPIVIEFKEKEIAITVTIGEGQDISLTGEYKIDDSAKPKSIDLLNFKSGDGGQLGDNKGIYTIDGETMKLCTGGPGNDRPTEFFPLEEGGRGTFTLTRVK